MCVPRKQQDEKGSMMKRSRVGLISFVSIAVVTLVVAACGGGDPTAIPNPTATSVPATATSVPATATSVAPTATPAAMMQPDSVILEGGQRGGTLNLRGIFRPRTWDTFEVRGRSAFYLTANIMSNLVWVDPYGEVGVLAGDLAENWEISSDGTEYTFFLRQDVRYHDGSPFTSEDAAYNLDRGWKPRSTTATNMRAAFAPIESIETPDPFVVRVTLSQPSHTFLNALGNNRALILPSGQPLPEFAESFNTRPIGTGPFKFDSEDGPVITLVRNDDYWRQGLPYLDSIVFNIIRDNSTSVAGMRTGLIDLEGFVGSATEGIANVERGNAGHVFYDVLNTINTVHVNQIEPWTDVRVRQAISLALDRHALIQIWQQGRGNVSAALIPPGSGGQFGITVAEMLTRPGYRVDKTADLARAKELLAEAGVDPSQVTMRILEGTSLQIRGEVIERAMDALGFKTELQVTGNAAGTDLRLQGAFDISIESFAPFTDEPGEAVLPWGAIDGPRNYGKWANLEVLDLFAQQDASVDPAERKQLLLEMQEIMLEDNTNIPAILRQGFGWYRDYVNDVPTGPLWFSNRFRYEQVWLDR